MSKKMILEVGVGILIFSAIACLTACSTKMKKDINYKEENIKVTDGVEVSLVNNINLDVECGNINIISEERQDLGADLFLKTTSEKPEVNSSIDGDTLNIKVIEPKSDMNLLKDVVLNVRIPKSYKNNLIINEKSGDITIDDISLSNIDITSFAGNISMKNIVASDFKLSSLGGEFSADNVKTKVTTLNCAGPVKMTEFAGDLKEIQECGDTDIQYSESFNNNLEVVNKTGGIISVKLTDSSNISLVAECSEGVVESKLPMQQIIEQKDNYLNVLIGDGKNKVKLSNKCGTIKITK